MSSLRHHPIVPIVIVLSLVVYFPSPATSQPESPDYLCDDSYGNYTSNSTYESNLHTLLSSITSNAPKNYGFYNLSVGENLDQVHGIALCRGDISMSDCRSCLRSASTDITRVCVSQKTATGVHGNCTLQYSNVNMLNGIQYVLEYKDYTRGGEIRDDDDQKSFSHTISALLITLANQAALGDYRRKFATGEAQVKLLDHGNKTRLISTVYALVQCTPNLEEYDCYFCLQSIVNYTLAGCCHGMQRAWVFVSSCMVRYDNYRFYGSASVLAPLASVATPSPLVSANSTRPSATTYKGNKSKKSRVVAVILIAAVATLVLIVLACYYIIRRTQKPLEKVENEDVDQSKIVESLQMDFGTVKTATDNFSESNRLGHGGCGTVYKGRLPNGQAIAVKRLNKNSTGDGKQEFKNEALLMAKLQHKNLVRFLGFCIRKDEKLLVYELLPNHNLDYFLIDPNKRGYLDWQNRYKIIQGIARGLLYLHEESRQLVVHRDLKPSNILLDTDMTPKISDFSMARLLGSDQSHANTSKIVGTSGYMPPEYIINGQFSIKTDVFSFGVLVLEIVSGQKVIEFSREETGESLLSLAWRHWLEGNPLILMDSEMAGVNSTEVLRCIHIGLLCVQENAAQRPIMSSVVLILNSHSVTLPVPSRPAFLAHNDMDSNPAPSFD